MHIFHDEGRKIMKKALILNITYNDIEMMKALKKMGYYVYAIGLYSGLHGQKYADEYIQQDYSKKDEVFELAKRLKVEAICACCNDTGVITAAYVAEKLGFKGHDTYENALLIHHKEKFNQFLIDNKMQTMFSRSYNEIEEVYRDVDRGEFKDFPFIVKPVDLCGGVGVEKVDNIEILKYAIEKAFSVSREKRIVIEKFIEGKQYGLCTFLVNQKVVKYVTNNEISVINPYRVEIDLFPSDCNPIVINDMVRKIETIAHKLKLVDGIFHIQFLEKDGHGYIIEAMRRVPGNLYTKLAKWITGIDWDYMEACTHCGRKFENIEVGEPERTSFCAYRSILATSNGIFKGINIPHALEKNIQDRLVIMKKGDQIHDYMTEQIELIFLKFDSYAQMEKSMINDYHKIDVNIG